MLARNIIKNSKNKKIEKYFITATACFLLAYAVFILFILGSNLFYTNTSSILTSLISKKTLHSVFLSLWTSAIATLLAILIGIPAGYALARYKFYGKKIIDLLIDIPITLPPLVAGLSLMIFFSLPLGRWIDNDILKFSFSTPGIILAQFIISASFAVITLKSTFEEVDESMEIVARSLGCNRFQAFLRTTLPSARYGIASAIVLTWSRAVGEFIPVLLFCGAMEGKTDILPIAIFMNIELGNFKNAVALTVIFIAICLAVLPLSRILAMKSKAV